MDKGQAPNNYSLYDFFNFSQQPTHFQQIGPLEYSGPSGLLPAGHAHVGMGCHETAEAQIAHGPSAGNCGRSLGALRRSRHAQIHSAL